MEKAIKSELQRTACGAIAQLINAFEEVNLGFEYDFDKFGLHILTPYFDKYGDANDYLFGPTLCDKLAFELKEADYPVSIEHVKTFCAFMEIEPYEADKLLAVAVPKNVWDEWYKTEKRLNSY